MLKSFSVKNYKGFKDEITLDLCSKRDYNYNEYLIKNNIINKCLIFGKNARGKTNLGYAIFDVVAHLTDKHHPRKDAYFLNADSSSNLADFKYVFSFNEYDLRYEYGKNKNMDLIYEKIYYDNELMFDFNLEQEILLSSEIDITDSIQWENKSEKMSAIKYMMTTFKFDEDYPLYKMFKFVNNMLWFTRCDKENNFLGFQTNSGTIDDYIYEHNLGGKLETFLRENDVNEKIIVEMTDGKPIIKFKYSKYAVPFGAAASSGTKALLLVFFWKEVAFMKASLVFMDEFDAFYHYELADSIVKTIFKESDFQTIMTTHNVTLLSNIYYRPDIYFEITKNTIKNLPDSTSRVIRQAHNLEKMYKAGVFGKK